jgi:two-component system sensor histidine kinase BaeS
VKRIWWRFGGLRWQLSLAMVGVVVLTAVAIGWLVTYTYEVEIAHFFKALDPGTRSRLERLREASADTAGTDLDARPELLLPVLLPLLGAVIVALTIASRIARPLEAVSKTARAVADGNLAVRVPLEPRQRTSEAESLVLARNFNAMADELEHLEGERRATSAAIAHELRTPLTILRGRLQAAVDGVIRLDEDEARVLLQQTEILTRLVDDLKTLSLAEAGRLSLSRAETDVTVLVTHAVAAYEHRALEKGVFVRAVVPPVPVMLYADAERLAQVLSNLLENAVRHTPSGGTVEARLEVRPGKVDLEVRDSGPGISPEALPHIFERFYRAEDSRSRASGGSGLGLAIVQAIVVLHGGRVTARNLEPSGAAFFVELSVVTPAVQITQNARAGREITPRT